MWYVPYYFINISKNIVQRIDEISELKARLFQLVLVGFALSTLRSLIQTIKFFDFVSNVFTEFNRYRIAYHLF